MDNLLEALIDFFPIEIWLLFGLWLGWHILKKNIITLAKDEFIAQRVSATGMHGIVVFLLHPILLGLISSTLIAIEIESRTTIVFNRGVLGVLWTLCSVVSWFFLGNVFTQTIDSLSKQMPPRLVHSQENHKRKKGEK